MDNRTYDDAISLKELILVTIKGWKSIVLCTVVVVLLALIYILGITKPIYESSISGVISIPETAISKYGTYTFPSDNKMDYLNVVTSYEVLSKTIDMLSLKQSVSTLRDQISIGTVPDQNTFTITAKSRTPELARELVKTLTVNLVDELSVQYKINAIDFFMRELTVVERQLQDEILKQEKLLETQKIQLEKLDKIVTLKRLLVDDPILAASIANNKGVDLASLSDEVMYEEMLNPNYVDLEAANIELEKSIQITKVSLEEKLMFQEELKSEVESINLYYTTGDQNITQNATLDIIRSRININKTASYNDSPVSPNKVLFLSVAVILGLMIGVICTLFKHYWKQS